MQIGAGLGEQRRVLAKREVAFVGFVLGRSFGSTQKCGRFWPAGGCAAAGVCAIAGDIAASTRAAAVTTFFFTIASNTLGMKT